jgi:hypothetical protein
MGPAAQIPGNSLVKQDTVCLARLRTFVEISSDHLLFRMPVFQPTEIREASRSNWVSWKIQSHAGFYKVTGMIVPSILESVRVSYSHGGDILMSLLTDSYLENKKLVYETVGM